MMQELMRSLCLAVWIPDTFDRAHHLGPLPGAEEKTILYEVLL